MPYRFIQHLYNEMTSVSPWLALLTEIVTQVQFPSWVSCLRPDKVTGYQGYWIMFSMAGRLVKINIQSAALFSFI